LRNRITHYFETLDRLLGARSAAPPEEPVTLCIEKHELAELLARNIMGLIMSRPAFFKSDEDQCQYEKVEAQRRALLNWVRQHHDEQLVVAVLPCIPRPPDPEEA
jgi:hypothetical protein